MASKVLGLAIAALFASGACGQTAAAEGSERVFYSTRDASGQDLQELAAAIRGIADIREIAADTGRKAVAVRATAGQAAFAEWLFNALDRPAGGPATPEYAVPDRGGEVARVFYLAHVRSALDIQEIVTLVRSTADIRRVFVCTAPKAVAVRDTPAAMAMAEWLIAELDRPAGAISPGFHEYRAPAARADDVLRVFFLAYPQSPQDVQDMATLQRSIADINRIFVYHADKAVAMRGSAAQAALAEWLVAELDKPAGTPAAPGAHEYRMPVGDDVVRVFDLPQARSAPELQETVAMVRKVADLQRIFIYNARKAMAVRGTADRIVAAERLIAERK